MVQQDMAQQDMVQQDMAQQDMVQQDMAQQDMAQQDMVQQDMAQQDMAQQDMVQQDMVQQDMVQQDMVKQKQWREGERRIEDSEKWLVRQECEKANEFHSITNWRYKWPHSDYTISTTPDPSPCPVSSPRLALDNTSSKLYPTKSTEISTITPATVLIISTARAKYSASWYSAWCAACVCPSCVCVSCVLPSCLLGWM